MQRLYCPAQDFSGNRIIIKDKKQIHYLKDVLRLKSKDALVVFDGRGREYAGFIRNLSPREVSIEIQEVQPAHKELSLLQVTLAVGIPKRSRMDYLIEKCTELGVHTIIPMRTERTVVAIKQDKESNRVARWEKVAIEASQQSGRATLPEIKPITEFSEVLLKIKDYDLAMLFCLIDKKTKNMREILYNFRGKRVLALVGPEGDFTSGEVHLAKEAGCILATLGQRILKVDTASIVIIAGLNLLGVGREG